MHKTREISHARRAVIQERKRQRQYEKWRANPNLTTTDIVEGRDCNHQHIDKITEESYGCHDCGAPFLVEIDNG